MPVEYGQRRGMGYRYSQDPAQQDWQEELKLLYAQQPENRRLAQQNTQFNISTKNQKDQFKTTNALTAAENKLNRKSAERTGMLGALGSLVGVAGAYAGTRQGGLTDIFNSQKQKTPQQLWYEQNYGNPSNNPSQNAINAVPQPITYDTEKYATMGGTGAMQNGLNSFNNTGQSP
jgi:hypothetical protein